jgi:hypothetical protein
MHARAHTHTHTHAHTHSHPLTGSRDTPALPPNQDTDSAGDRWQAWSKPQPNGSTAVIVINTGADATTLTVTPSDYVDAGAKGTVDVRDIWNHKDLGQVNAAVTMTFNAVLSHDSVFLLISPTSS